jgi:myo-inositol-1(or 4)-monophosphatase
VEPRDWLPRIEAEVRRIGAFQLEGFRAMRPDLVQVKTDAGGETSSVTRFDTESETLFFDWLQRSFPDHSLLGEESGHVRRDPAHYWLLDPIDGTSNFTHGIPFWGPSLAYWRCGRPELAVIFFPALDQMYVAWRGGGAWRNGARVHTSRAPRYSLSTSVALDSRSHLYHSLRLRTKVRILGSAIANQCYTADGTFTACRVRGRLWDVAAGILLVREAGGLVDSEPDVDRLDPAAYAADGTAPRITLDGRAHAGLEPLGRFMEPAPPAA